MSSINSTISVTSSAPVTVYKSLPSTNVAPSDGILISTDVTLNIKTEGPPQKKQNVDYQAFKLTAVPSALGASINTTDTLYIEASKIKSSTVASMVASPVASAKAVKTVTCAMGSKVRNNGDRVSVPKANATTMTITGGRRKTHRKRYCKTHKKRHGKRSTKHHKKHGKTRGKRSRKH